ncbi:ATP-dependent DNA helicase RuvA [Wielerella bovis]|uniref:ATP-dependent DNA helicase RuvA n=1 Tax=Wielerella bovis TaxID=2917790 RepID=UPI0020197B54|nr:ATP-dependent DNA helicase RuvA [Wielerella bovis]MCG7656372.1 ATP-dependent DNA helicase RuvA [Wielerella bovis]MCG7658597.1 ATP-dependent DNA helicase RuvA [Wielerella bovis]ULJ62898.1 ATP-dependent DNA helicase RuvA [Wielerella bovis]ULJ65128.1 ATP-dependent DNA helicase RuvA [Wielerella bovis]ULJ67402.1 ATP-dependent DNA helicase RuvA [Wielerella bovis]
MAVLIELVNVHNHRIYLNTDCIRRVEPHNEEPPTSMIVYTAGDGERLFEVEGYMDEVAEFLNQKLRENS